MITRKKLLIFPLIGFSLLLGSCSLIKVVRLVKSGEVVGKNYYYEIPFEVIHGKIILNSVIDNKDYRFIYDTGAMNLVAPEKKFDVVAETAMDDVNGATSTIELTKINEVKIGNATFKDQGFGMQDLNKIKEFSCFNNIKGLIGANMFRHSICQIDMNKKVLIVTDNRDSLHLTDAKIKFPFKPKLTATPIIKIKINGTEFKNVVFDYGSDAGIDLVIPDAKKDLLHTTGKVVETIGSERVGATGLNTGTTYYFIPQSIFLEDAKIDNQVVTYSNNGFPTIGTKIFKNYIVTIDWQKNMIYMQAQKDNDIKENQTLKSFGAIPRLQDHKLVVIKIIKGSSADKQGIELGDEIISVDNKDYKNISLKDYCPVFINGLFPKEATEATVVYKRGDKVFKKTLKKEKLL